MITSYSQVRLGNVTEVTVASDLTGTVSYHWYVDGLYVGMSRRPVRSFFLADDAQIRVEVLDSNDPAFDPVANAPAGFPARRTLWWIRSLGAGIDRYRVQQKEGSGDWQTVCEVFDAGDTWHYRAGTDRLTDLTDYTFRILPLDAAGNEGTPIVLGPERIVRQPDAPNFDIVYTPATQRVTFSLSS